MQRGSPLLAQFVSDLFEKTNEDSYRKTNPLVVCGKCFGQNVHLKITWFHKGENLLDEQEAKAV